MIKEIINALPKSFGSCHIGYIWRVLPHLNRNEIRDCLVDSGYTIDAEGTVVTPLRKKTTLNEAIEATLLNQQNKPVFMSTLKEEIITFLGRNEKVNGNIIAPIALKLGWVRSPVIIDGVALSGFKPIKHNGRKQDLESVFKKFIPDRQVTLKQIKDHFPLNEVLTSTQMIPVAEKLGWKLSTCIIIDGKNQRGFKFKGTK